MLYEKNHHLFDNVDDMWHDAIGRVAREGERLESRDGGCTELIGYHATLLNLDKTFLLNEKRLLDPAYAAAETLWYLSGKDEVAPLLPYASQYSRFAEDDGRAFGAYGYRWKFNRDLNVEKMYADQPEWSQLDFVIETLRKHPESRQAVMSMWQGGDVVHAYLLDKRDLPCTLSLQFILRKGLLCCVATMRSNDLWLGFPYDVFAFTTVQRIVAAALGVKCGSYTHQVGSLHYYGRNAEKIAACYADPYQQHNPDRMQPIGHAYKDWASPIDVTTEVKAALWCEERLRNRTEYPITDEPSWKAMRDLLICCESKLKQTTEVNYPNSPVLRQAIINRAKAK